MDLFTGGFQGASHQRDYRAFAVGARNVDDGGHVHVRPAQFAQQFQRPVELEVDQFRVQSEEPVEDGLRIGHGPLA